MNIDIYSDRAKSAVQAAQSLALAGGHQQFAPEHLLKALLDERDGLDARPDQGGGRRTLTAPCGSPPTAALAKLPKVEGGNRGRCYMHARRSLAC